MIHSTRSPVKRRNPDFPAVPVPQAHSSPEAASPLPEVRLPPRGAASRAASAVARSSYLLSSRTIGYAFSSTQFLNSSPRFS